MKKYHSSLWNSYYKIFLKLKERVAIDDPFQSADAVIVNSKYMAKIIETLWGEKPFILNPPVNIESFNKYCHKNYRDRDNSIVMLGRVTMEKRIDDIIKAIALTKNKPILRVIGGYNPSSSSYLIKLKKMARKKDVQIKFYLNAPRNMVIELLSSSKIFAHATIGEHFGVAVVEGMAAGCPVIIHKSGGPY
jgi:glycosyltransferase involved in cell wall biosynthesis